MIICLCIIKGSRVFRLGARYNQQSCGRWCIWVWISPPPRALHGVMTLSIPESAILNNGKVGKQVLCPHSQCFGSYFDAILLAPLCNLAAELFKCRLICRRRWRQLLRGDGPISETPQ